MQNLGVTSKEYYGMLWHFLQWSIATEHLSLLNCHILVTPNAWELPFLLFSQFQVITFIEQEHQSHFLDCKLNQTNFLIITGLAFSRLH